jgi:hypothetical protein
MGPKPVAEGSHKNRNSAHLRNWFSRTDSAPDKVLVEKLRSKARMIADLRSLEMRASATVKMTIKRIDRVGIDVRQNIAFPLNEAAEMGGSTNVPNGASRSVSVTFEVICKRIDVRATDSTAQAPQRLGRGEVFL